VYSAHPWPCLRSREKNLSVARQALGSDRKNAHLDWLLLTKRPGQLKRVYPWAMAARDNVWLGTTAENQRWANRRVNDCSELKQKCDFSLASRCFPPSTSHTVESAGDYLGIAGGESGVVHDPRTQTGTCPARSMPLLWSTLSLQTVGPLESRSGERPQVRTIEVEDGAGRLARLAWHPKRRVADAGWPHVG